VQFPGTSMAANAHQVLGDRSLEVGDFTTAIAYYQKALGCVEADQRENIAARLRLAAAMLGRRAGQPVTQPVDFGNRQIAAAEFEEIVSRLLKRNSDSTPDVAEAPRAARAAVAPAALAVQLWATLDSPMGQSPEAIPASHASTDWVARQTAATISGDTMFVSNRFQVAAYELSTGKKQWTHSTAGEAGSTHAWTLVSMRPVLAGQRVFVRRLTKDGPDLACLDAATGAIQWHTCKAGKVVADPLLARGMVIVLTQLVDTIGAFSRLQLTAFDPDSGKVNFQSFLVQLRGDQVDGQLAAAGELLVISVEGSVLCCDLRGRVRWLRKRLWIPTSVRSDTLDAPMQPYHRPPLVADGRLYVSQPGAPSVACLDLETGRVHWRRTLPGAIRLLGLHDGRLVVQTLAGFEALETKTGKTLWLHAVEAILDAHLGGLPGGLVYAALEPRRDGRKRPRMVWLDPAAGHPFGQWPLEQPTGKQPALGPLLFNANRVWAFGSQDGSKPERKIIELVSSGPAIAGHIPNPTLAHWANVPAHVQQAVSTVLPGWTLLSTDQDAQVGRHAELQGRREVLVTAASGSTALLARRVAVPPTGDAKLRLEVAGKSGATLKIHVRAAGRTFLETSLETSDWRQFDVDLSPLAGRTVWLCVVHEPPEEGTSYAYWQRMEIQATRHKER